MKPKVCQKCIRRPQQATANKADKSLNLANFCRPLPLSMRVTAQAASYFKTRPILKPSRLVGTTYECEYDEPSRWQSNGGEFGNTAASDETAIRPKQSTGRTQLPAADCSTRDRMLNWLSLLSCSFSLHPAAKDGSKKSFSGPIFDVELSRHPIDVSSLPNCPSVKFCSADETRKAL